NYDITLTKAMLLVWITETDTGDMDELNLPSSGYIFFRKVSAGVESYTQDYSPWISYSYYLRARRRTQQSNIVITNHALLCTDLFNGYEFLPAYNKAIIDEAHHFEDIASRQNGLKVDYTDVQFFLNQVGKTTEDKAISRIISHYTTSEMELPKEQWDHAIEQTKDELDQLFENMYQYIVKQKKQTKSYSDIGRLQYRFSVADEQHKQWRTIKEMAIRSTFHIRDIIQLLFLFIELLGENEWFDKHDKEKLDNMITSAQSFLDGIEHFFIETDEEVQVKWGEVDTNSANHSVYLYSEPSDISGLLKEQFFEQKESIVLTSATL